MIKRKTKKKLLKIRKILCKSIRKGIENIGTPIAKAKGII
jgi:hypothetical protein